MTYSIVARDPSTGQYGVAVASRFFAVGALVPHVRGGRCAVATQAFVNPVWGLESARRLADGETAEAIAGAMGQTLGAAGPGFLTLSDGLLLVGAGSAFGLVGSWLASGRRASA